MYIRKYNIYRYISVHIKHRNTSVYTSVYIHTCTLGAGMWSKLPHWRATAYMSAPTSDTSSTAEPSPLSGVVRRRKRSNATAGECVSELRRVLKALRSQR